MATREPNIMHLFINKSMLPAITMLVLLSACESGPTIRADGDPSVNMAQYKTFAFFNPVSTDKQAYTTILSTRLKDATRRELEVRGLHYDTSNPQLLINFNVNIQNKTDIQSSPSMSAGYGYYGYRSGMYGTWGGYPQDIQTIHYQEGTLSIDMVEAGKKQLVWQGVAQGRIKSDSVKDPGPAVDRVVTDIFTKFPVPAPGAPEKK
jgi:Domain of unknown function (DUF4136)